MSQLSSRLKIPEHPTDPLVTLHACCLYLSKEKEKRDGDGCKDDKKKRKESVS